jgi:hypothetical protein
MEKLDRKIRFGRYQAALAKRGHHELLLSLEALVREVAAKLPRGAAPDVRTARRRRRSPS